LPPRPNLNHWLLNPNEPSVFRRTNSVIVRFAMSP
jgi:hypothetical protein